MPCDTLATGLPSLSHVRLGKGTPVASHSSLAGSFTTTATVPPRLEMTGGTVRIKKQKMLLKWYIFSCIFMVSSKNNQISV